MILEYENIDKTQPYYLTIYDINGRIVHQENEQANYGHNLLYIEEVGELSQGMYFIQLRFGNQTYSSKLIKF